MSTESSTPKLPPRYQPLRLLGRGGGGEVWAVRDRVSGERLALKQLRAGANASERAALQAEVANLASLDGLGLPRVLRFGHSQSGGSFVVRELVEGDSLAELARAAHPPKLLLAALADAALQLSAMHRAGVLHGDVKPANVLCDLRGFGRLVDLGLAVPFAEDKVQARGFTPYFAAPELRSGLKLSVRTEVYALGASLRELLQNAQDFPARDAALALAVQATAEDPAARPPSADEFARALRAIAPREGRSPRELARAWRMVELPELRQELLGQALSLAPGEVLYLVGPAESGRSTALRQLAWQLGVAAREVAWLQRHSTEEHQLELHAALPADALVLIDDADSAKAQQALPFAQRFAQVRVARAAPTDAVRLLSMPQLPEHDAERLLRQALPALPMRLTRYVVERSARRPGLLAAAARHLSAATVVSEGDVERALQAAERGGASERAEAQPDVQALSLALDRGRFAEARALLSGPRAADWLQNAPFAVHAAELRVATALGEFERAEAAREALRALALGEREQTQQRLLGARLDLRRGQLRTALDAARALLPALRGDEHADAQAICGMAQLLLGEGEAALQALQIAVDCSESPRMKAIAYGSQAIALERLGKEAEANAAYTESLKWAERAEDAWTSATAHANLAGLLRRRGDLSGAIAHLEAGIALGEQAGAATMASLARLNLMSLDLHLGRLSRAAEHDAALSRARAQLPAHGEAQWLGLRAELLSQRGEVAEACARFAESAQAYRTLGRDADALELELSALLHEAQHRARTAHELLARLSQLEKDPAMQRAAREQHPVLWGLTHAKLLDYSGDSRAALGALDVAQGAANARGESELLWQLLSLRAKLLETLGQPDAALGSFAAERGFVAAARRQLLAAFLCAGAGR